MTRPLAPSRFRLVATLLAVASLALAGAGSAHDLDDADLDGFHDSLDNCVDEVNPDQRDSDGDGFGDACDRDLNNDGLTKTSSTPEEGGDNWVFHGLFGGDDMVADFDGDGVVGIGDYGKLLEAVGSSPARSATTVRCRPPRTHATAIRSSTRRRGPRSRTSSSKATAARPPGATA